MKLHNKYPARQKKHEQVKRVPVMQAEIDRDDERLGGVEKTVMSGIKQVSELLAGKTVTEDKEILGAHMTTEKGHDKVGGLDVELDAITSSTFNDPHKTVTISDASVRLELTHAEDYTSGSESFSIGVSRPTHEGGWEQVSHVWIEGNAYTRTGRLSSRQVGQEPAPLPGAMIESGLDGKLLTDVQQSVEASQQLLSELPGA